MENRVVARLKSKQIEIPRLPALQPRRRVAAYARVSTSSEDQLNSIDAQKTYYTEYIKHRNDWIFAGLYADEGISGLSLKRRDAFQRMIADALSGKIDLIITKSISRFARNTVDTLIHIRKLKEIGVAVYFEKEDLNTMDAKGEFMLTLLSCMAQEEARSISENVRWGKRKRMAEGKYCVPYKHFLGYEKRNGVIQIVPEQAAVVRYLYYLFFIGFTPAGISKQLMKLGIRSPADRTVWHKETVLSILKNEKYCGNALLQKTFITDFFTKRKKTNDGELPRYFVSNGHEAIIPPVLWDEVQMLIAKRGRLFSSCTIFSRKLICSQCGREYGRITRSDLCYKTSHVFYYRCRNKYEPGVRCRNPILYENEAAELFRSSIVTFLRSKWNLLYEIWESLSAVIVPVRWQEVRMFLFDAVPKLPYEEFVVTEAVEEILIKRAVIKPDKTICFEMINGDCVVLPILHKTPRRGYQFVLKE